MQSSRQVQLFQKDLCTKLCGIMYQEDRNLQFYFYFLCPLLYIGVRFGSRTLRKEISIRVFANRELRSVPRPGKVDEKRT